MGAQIVTIAMTAGTHAVEVGRQVAERLGFRYVNDEIIDRAAAQAGVSRETMAEVERSPSLLSRIVTAIASGVLGQSAVHISPEDIDASPSYQRLIQDVIRETAAQRRVVIQAHGASLVLAGSAGLLRVLVTASPATRARRLAAESGRDAHAAAREIERSDSERRSFFKRFHDLDEELPTHYDLVVNTDVLSAEEVARIIASAAGKD
jgi:cytidylate kinase